MKNFDEQDKEIFLEYLDEIIEEALLSSMNNIENNIPEELLNYEGFSDIVSVAESIRSSPSYYFYWINYRTLFPN